MRTIIAIIMLIAAASAHSVPARRVKQTVQAADGTVITVTLQGDERCHFYADSLGTPMRPDPATGLWAPAPFTESELAEAATRRARSRDRLEARAAHTRAGAMQGKKRGLVILAAFSDLDFVTPDTQAEFDQMFNLPGYSNFGNGGSVRDYFLAQSYGKLDIDFDVVGPITLPKSVKYYGKNNASGDDLHCGEFATDAIKAVDDIVDFSAYDWDDDGEVDQVFIVYAGYGEASGAPTYTIWPHEWTLTDAGYSELGIRSLKLDGVKIDTYACSNELLGKKGTKPDGVGTACHEFSHCLGLPDMYASGCFGMDQWSVMDYGCYNGNGYIPASYNAYERMYCGWIQPTILSRPVTVPAMTNIDDEGEAYIIYNDAHVTEYYLLQNIQRTGWNIDAPASGMLIIHVDYSYYAWLDNTVNSMASHQRVSPVCADNKPTTETVKTDLWPQPGKTALTDLSKPAATLFHANSEGKKFLGHPITGIAHNNGTVAFDFDGGGPAIAVDAPKAAIAAHTVFDLSGRKAATPARHGIYIIDGKKTAIK